MNRWDRRCKQVTLSIRTPDRKHLSRFQCSFWVMYKKEMLVILLQMSMENAFCPQIRAVLGGGIPALTNI